MTVFVDDEVARRRRDVKWLGGLPRRDLIFIPCLIGLTALILLALTGACELAARRYMPGLRGDACLAEDDYDGISHGLPNCRSEGQVPGGPRVLYSFNECGYRNPSAGCGVKPPDTKRIVVMGASFAEGYPVAIENSFSGKLQSLLDVACSNKVEVENIGALGNDLSGDYRTLDEALRLEPSLVILAVLPSDLVAPNLHSHIVHRNEPIALRPQGPSTSLRRILLSGIQVSRLDQLIRHLRYRDADYYVETYLRTSASAGYLRPSLPPIWEQRLEDLGIILGDMSKRVSAAGARLALLFAPSRAQAAVLARPGHFADVDPWLLPRRLAQITARHGVLFLDTSRDVSEVRQSELLYFDLDGHPNERGQALIAGSMAQAILSDPSSAFAACQPGRSGSE